MSYIVLLVFVISIKRMYESWNNQQQQKSSTSLHNENVTLVILKDNLPHNTYQIYVKPHLKNTQMTLEYQILDEKALE